jgi:hypothetical protein
VCVLQFCVVFNPVKVIVSAADRVEPN